MYSALEEIKTLRARKEETLTLSEESLNPYIIVLKELTGELTYYCFSVPIRDSTKNLVELKWKKIENAFVFHGTNGIVSVCGNKLNLTNSFGKCDLQLPDRYNKATEVVIKRNYSELFPTLNGVLIRTKLGQGREFNTSIVFNPSKLRVKKTDKFFTLIKEDGTPLVTISGICFSEWNNAAMCPVDICGKKRSSGKYDLTIKPKGPVGRQIYIDIHMNEPTLFQDSTIESLHPNTNNAFGSAAFVGMTVPFGTQWLYSEFSLTPLSELKTKRLKYAVLHIPRYSLTQTVLDAFHISNVSHATTINWINKPALGSYFASTVFHNKYQDLDITKWIQDEKTNTLKDSCQMILKPQKEGRRFTCISTADCSYAPQIMELQFN